jgi:hypothetical protein
VPELHLPSALIPFVYRALAHVIVVVVFRASLDHCPPECDVDPPAIVCILASPLGDRMEPVRLGLPSHQYHVSTGEGKLDWFRLWQWRCGIPRRDRFMLHEEVSRRAQREGRNSRERAEEALIVAMICYTVGPRGVVIDETEVKLTTCRGLGGPSKGIEAFGEGAGWVFEILLLLLSLPRGWHARLGVDDGPVLIEAGGGINAEDGGKSRQGTLLLLRPTRWERLVANLGVRIWVEMPPR